MKPHPVSLNSLLALQPISVAHNDHVTADASFRRMRVEEARALGVVVAAHETGNTQLQLTKHHQVAVGFGGRCLWQVRLKPLERMLIEHVSFVRVVHFV